jgi:hypothetical protein
MNLDQLLRELNDHPDDAVANWAADAHELQTQLKSNAISLAEYKELLQDLRRGQEIIKATNDLDTQSAINQATHGLLALASLA